MIQASDAVFKKAISSTEPEPEPGREHTQTKKFEHFIPAPMPTVTGFDDDEARPPSRKRRMPGGAKPGSNVERDGVMMMPAPERPLPPTPKQVLEVRSRLPPWFVEQIKNETLLDMINYLRNEQALYEARMKSNDYLFLKALGGHLGGMSPTDLLDDEYKNIFVPINAAILAGLNNIAVAIPGSAVRTTPIKTPRVNNQPITPINRREVQETINTLESFLDEVSEDVEVFDEDASEELQRTLHEIAPTMFDGSSRAATSDLGSQQMEEEPRRPMAQAQGRMQSGAPPRRKPDPPIQTAPQDILLQYLADQDELVPYLQTYYERRLMNNNMEQIVRTQNFIAISSSVYAAIGFALTDIRTQSSCRRLAMTKYEHYIIDENVRSMFSRMVSTYMTQANMEQSVRDQRVGIMQHVQVHRGAMFTFFQQCIFDGRKVVFSHAINAKMFASGCYSVPVDIVSEYLANSNRQILGGNTGIMLPPGYV
jgi:hypothetical protein